MASDFQSRRSPEFTGRHMLAIMLAFFGVIIAVNVTMAMVAGTSWTGFVVKNSYVASQEFNGKIAEARAQAALGWTSDLSIAGGEIRFALADQDGSPVRMEAVEAVLRRPAYEAEDIRVTLHPAGPGVFAAQAAVRDGLWIVDIAAEVGREHPYHDARRVTVANGAMQ